MSKLLNFISHYLQIKHYINTLQHCSHTFLKKIGFKIYHSKNSHLRLILTTPFFLIIVWACDQAVSLDSLYNKLETLSMLSHLYRLAALFQKKTQNFSVFFFAYTSCIIIWSRWLGQLSWSKNGGEKTWP